MKDETGVSALMQQAATKYTVNGNTLAMLDSDGPAARFVDRLLNSLSGGDKSLEGSISNVVDYVAQGGNPQHMVILLCGKSDRAINGFVGLLTSFFGPSSCYKVDASIIREDTQIPFSVMKQDADIIFVVYDLAPNQSINFETLKKLSGFDSSKKFKSRAVPVIVSGEEMLSPNIGPNVFNFQTTGAASPKSQMMWLNAHLRAIQLDFDLLPDDKRYIYDKATKTRTIVDVDDL